MKQILLLFAALVFMLGQVSAQVTIGSEIEPNKGTLLDLKEYDTLGVNSTKGLGLPRVQLTTISSLNDIAPNLDKDEHVGLVVYVPEAFENSCPGVYVWTGEKWQGVNTDSSMNPEYITVDDVDGNTYTAKLFNRKGCYGGVYWFTSNLRTTKYNDETPVASTTHPSVPMFLPDGKANTWEIYFDENNTLHNTVRTKSDILSAKTIQYYEDGVLLRQNLDEVATKFGLMYLYSMAFDGTIGATAVEKKLCPEGWRIPTVMDWINVGVEMGATDPYAVFRDAAEYFASNKFIAPVDYKTVFAVENLRPGTDLVDVNVDHPEGWGGEGWALRIPEVMSKGQLNSSGLNVYPSGRMSVAKADSNINTGVAKNAFVTKDWSFGGEAFFLEKTNGSMLIRGYRTEFDGSAADQMAAGGKNNELAVSVRCIKVVE